MEQKASSTEGGEIQSCLKSFPLTSWNHSDNCCLSGTDWPFLWPHMVLSETEGHSRCSTVVGICKSQGRLSTDMMFFPTPPRSGLHQAAILSYKLCFDCNINQTLWQTPSSAASHSTSVPLAISNQVLKQSLWQHIFRDACQPLL